MREDLKKDIESVGKENYVRTLFDSIAPHYDFLNLVMTGGLVRWWHRAFARSTRLRPGDTALDLACGTGDLTAICARQVGPRGHVVGLDLSQEMLSLARRKLSAQGLEQWTELVLGNALELPFADESFDCASIGFALRNVVDIERTLREMARVVRPGGRVVAMEISKPQNRLIRWPYFVYFYNIVPLLDRAYGWVGGKVRPYTYLPHSLTHFPDQERLAETFRSAGLTDVYYQGLTGGVVTLHVGVKP